MSELTKAVGLVIRNRRKSIRWTLEELKDVTGVSLGYLSQVELGKNEPSLGVVELIARGFGVSVSTIFIEAEAEILKHASRNGPREQGERLSGAMGV